MKNPLLLAALGWAVQSAARVQAEPPFRLTPLPVAYENHSGPTESESDGDTAITHMVGAGVCVLDYDMDGAWDLFLPDRKLDGVEASGSRLYRGERLDLVDVTASAGLAVTGWALGCAVADVDNDGDPDLFVTRLGTNQLFRNRGDGTFVEDPAFTDVSAWSTSATFSDLDLDGLVDLYVCNYIDLARVDLKARCPYYGVDVFCGPNGLPGAPDALYRNTAGEGGGFRDVTREAGVYSRDTRGFSVLAVNLDEDRLPDIHVANDAGVDLVFENLGGFRFEDVSLLSGAGYSALGMEQSGMGSTAGDFDGDGDADLYVTNFQRDYNSLYRNEGALTFTDTTNDAGLALPTLPHLAWGTHFLDVSNDGRLDLFVANGHIYPELEERPEVGEPYRQRVQLFVGDGEGRFAETLAADDLPARLGRGTAAVDLDDNGAVDVVVNNLGERPDLYLGDETTNGWVRLRLVGTSSNRDGLNAVVRARPAGDESVLRRELHVSDGFLGSGEPRLHFGLGRAELLDEATFHWPSGVTDQCRGLRSRSTYIVKEGVGCLLLPSHP